MKIPIFTLVVILLLFSKVSYAITNQDLKITILRISNRIIDNKVQISNINTYISNLQTTYASKQASLQKNFNAFTTSVAVLYKLKLHPKETLLVQQNINQDQILNVYVIINYWIKYASSQIYKIYLTLNSIQKLTKQLNLAKQQLQNLNTKLQKNQKLLSVATQNQGVDLVSIEQINQIRHDLKYSALNLKNNSKLLTTIGLPTLTPKDKLLDADFIQHYKGHMTWPNTGYLYSNYQNSKYYNIYYYGLVIVGLPLSKVLAPAQGEVIFNNTISKYKHVIIIKHSPSFIGIISGDFHPVVKLAQIVTANQPLATIGNATTPIYFELDQNNQAINPQTWLTARKGGS